MTRPVAGPRFAEGQRLRLKRHPRSTGRVTGTWQHPGDESRPPQAGVIVTMDSQFSPPPVPVRYQTLGEDFQPLPGDWLDDTEAMEQIAQAVTHIPGDWEQAAAMLDAVLAILGRNGRAGDLS